MKQKSDIAFVVLNCLLWGFFAMRADANIIIKVRALNPLETEEAASISYPLPPEVTPGDIVEKKITFSLPHEEDQEAKTTFNVEYVPEEGRYYIVDEVPLGPREVVTLEVHVRDIWSIAPETLEAKRKSVEGLVAQYHPVEQTLEGTEPPEEEGEAEEEAVDDETVTALKDQIFEELEGVAARQTQNTVLKVGVEQHMEAYYENLEALSQMDADIQMLRYLLEPEPEEEVEEGEEQGAQEEMAPEDTSAPEEEVTGEESN